MSIENLNSVEKLDYNTESNEWKMEESILLEKNALEKYTGDSKDLADAMILISNLLAQSK